jgi:3-oxoacyl-[acyl-carrier-protein] synthase-1
MGSGTAANWEAILEGTTGVQLQVREAFRNQPVCAALFTAEQWQAMQVAAGNRFTPFETLLWLSIEAAVSAAPVDFADPRTLLIIASTKGNIGLLQDAAEQDPQALVSLSASAKKLAHALGYPADPIIVSNACISGMTALLTAKRLMEAGLYDRAVVTGADCISPFIVAGFRSFQALSDEPCQPFDLHRKGINLGEGAATMILGSEPAAIRLSGGSTSSDANHISGPSRTGAEMAQAIKAAMHRAGVTEKEIAGICAHGTATPYNDEMEARAFGLSGLAAAPAFSLKGYFGHTLGAAGLLEMAITAAALEATTLPASRGYREHGVSVPIQVAAAPVTIAGMQHLLKTGSGFGGCNAAIVMSKNQ